MNALPEKETLRTLNNLICRMKLNERYALAIEAISLHAITSTLVSIEFVDEISEELAAARELLSRLSATARGALAIDILNGDYGEPYEDDEDDEDEDEDEDEDD